MKGRNELAERIARDLLRIGALAISVDEPFTWASGIESPVYCDNRLTLGYPGVRDSISDGFRMLTAGLTPTPDVVVGTATAGIPHAAWLAQRLELPMAYVRSAAKKHGKQNRIEGRVNEGALAVVVEDLVSTGGSSLEAVRCLRESGVTIAAVLAIFSYELPVAATAFAAAEVPLETLTSFSTLVKVAEQDGQLDAPSVERLRIWHRGLSRMPSP